MEVWINSANSKKMKGGRLEEYRGVTLMPVTYKVYAEV